MIKMIFGSDYYKKEQFFHKIPEEYHHQIERKLNVLKRHGIAECLNTVFLRPANQDEAPANYVLILQESNKEPIFILLSWKPDDEIIYFIKILPVRFSP